MSTAQSSFCQPDQDATAALASWAKKVRAEAETPFAAAQQLAARLGTHYNENGRTTVGFWVPELVEQGIPAKQICLQVLRPLNTIDFQADTQTVRFRQEKHPLALVEECAWGVFTGLQPGRRDQVGDFYQLAYRDAAGVAQANRPRLDG